MQLTNFLTVLSFASILSENTLLHTLLMVRNAQKWRMKVLYLAHHALFSKCVAAVSPQTSSSFELQYKNPSQKCSTINCHASDGNKFSIASRRARLVTTMPPSDAAIELPTATQTGVAHAARNAAARNAAAPGNDGAHKRVCGRGDRRWKALPPRSMPLSSQFPFRVVPKRTPVVRRLSPPDTSSGARPHTCVCNSALHVAVLPRITRRREFR